MLFTKQRDHGKVTSWEDMAQSLKAVGLDWTNTHYLHSTKLVYGVKRLPCMVVCSAPRKNVGCAVWSWRYLGYMTVSPNQAFSWASLISLNGSPIFLFWFKRIKSPILVICLTFKPASECWSNTQNKQYWLLPALMNVCLFSCLLPWVEVLRMDKVGSSCN